jgi:hypothetical protein
MITPNVQARRATIEDLQKLMPLWEHAGLSAGELGKRLQEFQVLEAENGEIAGAIGLQIAGLEARLHHECFAADEDAEAVRAKLWERIQMISKNHGLARIWAQFAGRFWDQNGFQPAPPEVVSTLPPAFAGQAEPWSYLQLRENVAASPAIEKEFAIFKERQLEERERAFSQARKMKVVALVAVLAVFALLVIWAALWLKTPLRPKP